MDLRAPLQSWGSLATTVVGAPAFFPLITSHHTIARDQTSHGSLYADFAAFDPKPRSGHFHQFEGEHVSVEQRSSTPEGICELSLPLAYRQIDGILSPSCPARAKEGQDLHDFL
jgi:hypothetical protein